MTLIVIYSLTPWSAEKIGPEASFALAALNPAFALSAAHFTAKELARHEDMRPYVGTLMAAPALFVGGGIGYTALAEGIQAHFEGRGYDLKGVGIQTLTSYIPGQLTSGIKAPWLRAGTNQAIGSALGAGLNGGDFDDMLDAAWKGAVAGVVANRWGSGNAVLSSGLSTATAGLLNGDSGNDILRSSLTSMAIAGYQNPGAILGLPGAVQALPGKMAHDIYNLPFETLYALTANPIAEAIMEAPFRLIGGQKGTGSKPMAGVFYRRLGIDELKGTYPLTGHTGLVFNTNGGGDLWADYLEAWAPAMTQYGVVNENGVIVMSFHPDRVVSQDYTHDRVGTFVTDSSTIWTEDRADKDVAFGNKGLVFPIEATVGQQVQLFNAAMISVH